MSDSAIKQTTRRLISNQRLIEFGSIGLALIGTVAIAATRENAPQLTLLILLYVLTINFGTPLTVGSTGLMPIVAISSVLALDVPTALIGAAIGPVLAELLRPLWRPLWRTTLVPGPTLRARLMQGVVLWLALGLTSLTYLPLLDGQSLISRLLARVPNTSETTFAPVLLTLVYFALFIVFSAVGWALLGASPRAFFAESASYLLGVTFFAVPMMLFFATAEIGMPAFVLLCVAIATFAVVSWTAWQRRTLNAQRINQLAQLNAAGAALRETLDLSLVLQRTLELVEQLIQSDRVGLYLIDEQGRWEAIVRRGLVTDGWVERRDVQPDGLTAWVVAEGRTLELDQTSLHFAEKRRLTLPTPPPRAWLGVPLEAAERTLGALVLVNLVNDDSFSRWSREVLLAIAAQAAAAIQNARRHQETVLLYNLADAELSRRLDQLQALVNSTAEGVLMVDRQGEIVLVNPPAARLLASSAAELQQRTLDIAMAAAIGFAPDALAQLLADLRNGAQPAQRRSLFESNLDGRRRYFERNEVPVSSEAGASAPAADATGGLMGWLMVFRDVTEERERAEWRADLTRMIVHDLRNPITTLSSSINLIENRLPGSQRLAVDDLLTTARHGCASMLEMVDSLMDINRAEVGKFVIDADAMRMTTLVAQVMQTVEPLAVQRNILLTYDVAPDVPPVWGDRDVLRRVLINLLDNALKFTPSGGNVTLALWPQPAADDGEPGAHVTIKDSGPGIPADQRARIFDRFITFNRGGAQVRGTGLGLTFCKLAVEAHGGQIWVEDAADGGSVFHFTVPGIPAF